MSDMPPPEVLGIAGHPGTVPGYSDLSFVGRGGSARVYRATATSGAEVAIKVYDDDDTTAQRELDALRQLTGVPHVVQVLDAGELPDGRPWVALEFASKGSCQRLIESGPVPWEAVVRLGSEAADALAAAHAAGIVHGDIKPSNLLLGGDGRTLLSDFGTARLDPAATGTVTFTLRYAAPELIDGATADERSDVYGLGLTLRSLLEGVDPFDTSAAAGIGALVESIHSGVPDLERREVPAWLRSVLRRSTARDPGDRYPNAEALSRALHQREAVAPPRSVARMRRKSVIVACALLVALGAAIAATTLPNRPAAKVPVDVAGAVAERSPSIANDGGVECTSLDGSLTIESTDADPSAWDRYQPATGDLRLDGCTTDDGRSIVGRADLAGQAVPLNATTVRCLDEASAPALLSGDLRWDDGSSSRVDLRLVCDGEGTVAESYLAINADVSLVGGDFAGPAIGRTELRLTEDADSADPATTVVTVSSGQVALGGRIECSPRPDGFSSASPCGPAGATTTTSTTTSTPPQAVQPANGAVGPAISDGPVMCQPLVDRTVACTHGGVPQS